MCEHSASLAGGLIEDLSHNKLPTRYVYALILVITIVLTWQTNVNQIIAYASRAFALFYCLQCCVAYLVAREQRERRGRALRSLVLASLAVVCLAVFAFGLPSE